MRYVETIGIIVIVLIILSGCTSQPDTSEKKEDENDAASEVWVKDSSVVFTGTTSTSSLVLSNGTVRTYLMGDGIYYRESVDGKTFGEKVLTSITGGFNPAVVFVQDMFILFYNIQGGDSGPPDPYSSQLWRATSADGKVFSDPVKIADLSEDPLAVVDVPDVIVLPDGRLRMYATQMSGEGGINTAVSDDLGLTWVVDGTGLIDPGACDPDVHIEEGPKYVMYYTQTIAPEGMSKAEIKAQGLDSTIIRRATSEDGVDWVVDKQTILSSLPDISENGFVIDPDYVKLTTSTEILYFGQATGKDVDLGIIDVYFAVKTK